MKPIDCTKCHTLGYYSHVQIKNGVIGNAVILKCDICGENFIPPININELLPITEHLEIPRQIELMTQYAQMMLDRKDYHGLWDAAIDLQRLEDKLENDRN